MHIMHAGNDPSSEGLDQIRWLLGSKCVWPGMWGAQQQAADKQNECSVQFNTSTTPL
jgi:hypothetical protein